MFGLFAVLAEFERELIVERTKAGLASARAHGRNGGRPFRGGLSSTFRISGQAEGSAERPEDVLMRDEVEGVINGQDGFPERADSRPSLLPR